MFDEKKTAHIQYSNRCHGCQGGGNNLDKNEKEGGVAFGVSWNARTKWSLLAFEAEYGLCGLYFVVS